MINKFNWLIYIVVALIMVCIYFSCFNVAKTGYGYSGYKGFHRHHSFWYFRGYEEGYNPSNRENSVGGNKFSQRGLSGGK